jgi:SAM-dependent methyltransferase
MTSRWQAGEAGEAGAAGAAGEADVAEGAVIVARMGVYDRLGAGYTRTRRTDPRIAAQVRAALGSQGPVLNVGAGAGAYEPDDLPVVAVEPSAVMVDQRPPRAAPVVRAEAERLPFGAARFGAGMAVLTVHHWADCEAGLAELRRTVRGPVVVLSWDAEVFDRFWMVSEYVPASGVLYRHVPRPKEIADLLGGGTVETVPVPADCTDGFYAAWWRRPWAYLNSAVRAGISGLARLPPDEVQPGIEELGKDLARGTWARRHADLLELDAYDAGYRLIVSPGPTRRGGATPCAPA